jgi:crossover junction endodeoxyribonuclease RusA
MARRPRKENEPKPARVLDVCVHGQPISAQTASRRALAAWKQQVRVACLAAWRQGLPPVDGSVGLRVTYFCEAVISDIDNLVKPIQDALQGIAYYNDQQVSDLTGRRRDIDGTFSVRYMSPALAMAFSDGRAFVHIEVWRNPDQEVLS